MPSNATFGCPAPVVGTATQVGIKRALDIVRPALCDLDARCRALELGLAQAVHELAVVRAQLDGARIEARELADVKARLTNQNRALGDDNDRLSGHVRRLQEAVNRLQEAVSQGRQQDAGPVKHSALKASPSTPSLPSLTDGLPPPQYDHGAGQRWPRSLSSPGSGR